MAKKGNSSTTIALGGEQNESPEASFSSKQMLKEHGEAGTKIKFNDRLTVEIIKETQYYKVGKVINPHKIVGEAYIKQGIAKKYEAPEE